MPIAISDHPHPLVAASHPANSCDICNTRGTVRRCSAGCDWDVCLSCWVQRAGSRTTGELCPAHHPLTRFALGQSGFTCDVCDQPQAPGALLWGCRTCDWDRCELCGPVNVAELGFRQKMDRAIQRVRVVLGDVRVPAFRPDAVHHKYEDKYQLVESATNAALASQMNCLSLLGLDSAGARQLREWARDHEVSLSFRAIEQCHFEREETRTVESPTQIVEEHSNPLRRLFTQTTKTVTRVTEYSWTWHVGFELLALRSIGADASDRLRIWGHAGTGAITTRMKGQPRPKYAESSPKDVNISWLLRALSEDAAGPCFSIGRQSAECRTPRRNPDVENSLGHFSAYAAWARAVGTHLEQVAAADASLVGNDRSNQFPLAATAVSEVFNPVLPLFRDEEAVAAGDSAKDRAPEAAADITAVPGKASTLQVVLSGKRTDSGSRLLGADEFNRLLAEEQLTLRSRREALAFVFPDEGAVISAAEALLAATLLHCAAVCAQHCEALDYVEGMVREQLIAAISKELMPSDFAEYMRFHNRKLFADGFAPVPFCFSVRRSQAHAPEGILSIEEAVGGAAPEPIATLVARSSRPHPMRFALSAAANVVFQGDRYLHAWVSHNFSDASGPSMSLVARARQFSSMIVLLGRIVSESEFEPKFAAIVRDKDEIKVPLELSTIPTPKEFRDAIESLSPEQQRFAKAFRAMQLESTLFGVLVIQVRPQLERVLNLPEDALTKDIRLTQELTEFFTMYQIPSDLLSFDGDDAVPSSDRVAAVRDHAAGIRVMIQQAKEREVFEANQQRLFNAPPASHVSSAAFMPDEALEQRQVIDALMHQNIDQLLDRGERIDTLDVRSRELTCQSKVFYKKAGPSKMNVLSAGMKFLSRRAGAGAASTPAGESTSMVESSAAAPAPEPAAPTPAFEPVAATSTTGTTGKAPDGTLQQTKTQTQDSGGAASESSDCSPEDYTLMPAEMDRRFLALDVEGTLRPTIVSPGEVWTKTSQKSLLARPVSATLSGEDLKREKNAAFDLLDALTRSGSLSVQHADLHILLAATHCFDKSVTETVVQDNVSPIDRVERSMLIMATTVHRLPASALVRDHTCMERLATTAPQLLAEKGP